MNRRDETAIPVVDLSHSKRAVKRAYLKAEIGLSDAIPELMFDHGMDHSEAICYLMDVR